MVQKQSSSQPFEDDGQDDAAPVPAASQNAQGDALDDLLDEIDGTLQVNAEQFVRSFVQKGGE